MNGNSEAKKHIGEKNKIHSKRKIKKNSKYKKTLNNSDDIMDVEPIQWVDENITVISMWLKKEVYGTIDMEDVKQDAYEAAILATKLCTAKKLVTRKSFNSAFFNFMRRTYLTPEVKTTPFSAVWDNDESFTQFVEQLQDTKHENLYVELMDFIESKWEHLTEPLEEKEEAAARLTMGLTFCGIVSGRDAEEFIQVKLKKSRILTHTKKAIQVIGQNIEVAKELQRLKDLRA